MDDDQLERRLRRDPTMDPMHQVGAFRDRLADRAIGGGPSRRREGARVGGPLAVAATLLVIVALIAGRAGQTSVGPGSSLPPASPAPLPSARLQALLSDWAHGGAARRATLAVIGPTGETWTGSSARAGEQALETVKHQGEGAPDVFWPSARD